jgi:malate dehydrogenase
MGIKITVVGAGAVGATLAQRILESGIADVVLIDIAKNMAIGKAYDLLDAAPVLGHEKTIKATDDYKEIKGSSIVVITAGLARKPGMTREDLVAKNAAIIRDVSNNIKAHASDAIIIVVTNPLDAMTYLAYKTTGFKKNKVLGMAGVLDSSRFINLLAEELKVPRSSIRTFILGSHGDTMVAALSRTTVNGMNLRDCITKDKLDNIVKRTCDRGAEIVQLYGTGSAFYSPSAAVYKMITAIVNDTKEVMPVSAYLEGEYGLKDIYIGVPCRIGKNGIEEVIHLEISKEEKEAFLKSAQAIKGTLELIK